MFAAAVLMQGCKDESAMAKMHEKLAKAEARGQRAIANAQANLDKVLSEESKHSVVTDKDTRGDSMNSATPMGISAPNDSLLMSRSKASKTVRLALYDLEKARADAAYEIANVQCGEVAATAQRSCLVAARTRFEISMDATKTQENLGQAPEQVAGMLQSGDSAGAGK